MKKLFLGLALAAFTLSIYSCRETTETETTIEEVEADVENEFEEAEAEIQDATEEVETEVQEIETEVETEVDASNEV